MMQYQSSMRDSEEEEENNFISICGSETRCKQVESRFFSAAFECEIPNV